MRLEQRLQRLHSKQSQDSDQDIVTKKLEKQIRSLEQQKETQNAELESIR